ncbi:TPA: hypothetical protein HA361_04910 [Candidatus Woesearchaeota archaeon]|nr:hypothetical protein [Candidatus Woesearchaeota archaeon]HII69301.1 hypothetical protein [Candidatus Woesearchaeota archaeon]
MKTAGIAVFLLLVTLATLAGCAQQQAEPADTGGSLPQDAVVADPDAAVVDEEQPAEDAGDDIDVVGSDEVDIGEII